MPLRSWLLDESSDSFAVETIRKSPILSDEARRVIPALRQAALRPATEDEIKRIIESRFELFRQPQRSDAQWALWWAEYLDALSDLTPYAIESGMAAWVRSPEAEFMVKPGKLRELARSSSNNNRWAKAHMRAVNATKEPVEIAAPQAEPAGEDRPSKEEMAAMIADFRQQMQAKDRLREVAAKRRPSPQAKVDDTGVSPEARAMLQRQGFHQHAHGEG